MAAVGMPDFDGATQWLNSEPLSPEALRGRVVLVNFWTLTCINWLRTTPYVRAWSQAYRDDGLVVIGVHTPEFRFEKQVDLVRQANAVRGIDYPVALDSEYAIWRSFDNHYWPALYFFDREGNLRDRHFGEGRYEGSEESLQELLGISRPHVPVHGIGVEADADWVHLRSPETYLGHLRSGTFTSLEGAAFDRPHTYEIPPELTLNHWALRGDWTIEPEYAELHGDGGSIAHRFHARDAHLVLAAGASDPIPFQVLLDGAPPGASAGADVEEDGFGELREGRMYQLIRATEGVRDRTLEITFVEPGAQAYAFTFG
jgi:thiol-disulfide isomerase/thioredoxin